MPNASNSPVNIADGGKTDKSLYPRICICPLLEMIFPLFYFPVQKTYCVILLINEALLSSIAQYTTIHFSYFCLFTYAV